MKIYILKTDHEDLKDLDEHSFYHWQDAENAKQEILDGIKNKLKILFETFETSIQIEQREVCSSIEDSCTNR